MESSEMKGLVIHIPSDILYCILSVGFFLVLSNIIAISVTMNNWMYMKIIDKRNPMEDNENDTNKSDDKLEMDENENEQFECAESTDRIETSECCDNEEELEMNTVAPVSDSRPPILQGTNINTGQFVSILYKMIMPIFSQQDINKDCILFHPEVPLIKILNYMKPKCFVRMSAACQKLRAICKNSRQLMINYRYLTIKFNDDYGDLSFCFEDRSRTMKYSQLPSVLYEQMKKLPFHFQCGLEIKIRNVNAQNINVIKGILDSFKNITVGIVFVKVLETIDWREMLFFARDYRFEGLTFNDTVIPEEFRGQYLKIQLNSMRIQGPCNFYRLEEVKIPILILENCALSIYELYSLIQSWLRTSLPPMREWYLRGHSFDKPSFIDCFESNFKLTDNDGTLPASRPVLIKWDDEGEPLTYWMLNEQNKVIEVIFKERNSVEIKGHNHEFHPHLFYEYVDFD